MQALFSYSFNQDEDLPTDELETYQKIVSLLSEIDPEIAKFAPERPLSEINRVDLAILRLVVYESKHTKVPTKVIINEAVELAKEFGTESSPRFVNGVLGQMLT
ncbi:transcription antitermination factor NusB [Patescibacteria group bacterium]|nr:transcription antitermination factor NusB [Patescibacteria group bacterium]MBU1967101.1 transcription antitermination factor NusB [Patescibacteria group bacterium]MBU2543025.1 transcription antitermination factor NusB [Patescibacteria group bacterium]